MRLMSSDEFCSLEVINLCGGVRLGFPCELEIDLECAKVISLTVSPADKCFSLFGDKDEYVIPWCKIDCIGEDAILVKLPESELSSCRRGKRRKKNRQNVNNL